MPSLQTKIVKVYIDSLQSDRSTFATVYGAIFGINELGTEFFESIVTPIIKKLGERVTQILDSPATTQEKKPAEKVKELVTVILYQLVNRLKSYLPFFLIKKLTCNVLKSKTPAHDELDHLTTIYGAYFGPFIHATLGKIRSQAQQAQKAAYMNQPSQQTTRIQSATQPTPFMQQQNRPQVTQVTSGQQQPQQKIRVVNPNMIRPKIIGTQPTPNPLQQQSNQFNIQNQYQSSNNDDDLQ